MVQGVNVTIQIASLLPRLLFDFFEFLMREVQDRLL